MIFPGQSQVLPCLLRESVSVSLSACCLLIIQCPRDVRVEQHRFTRGIYQFTDMDDGIGEDALHKVLAKVFGESHYEIVKSCVIDIRENFNCVIRTCFEEDPSMTFFQQCESWKRKFVAAVHCNFIYWEQKVGKYYEFRKQYVCHLNSRNKSEIGERNLKCWARLEFKKFRIPKSDSTRWRDLKRGGFLSKGLDTEIKVSTR